MERLMRDKEGTFNLCQCTNPFTFESDPLMVEDLMVAHNMVFKRSPDMELYNMMKVDTSAYNIDHNLLEQMKNDLTMMPNTPGAAPLEISLFGFDLAEKEWSFITWLNVVFFSVFYCCLGICCCFVVIFVCKNRPQ